MKIHRSPVRHAPFLALLLAAPCALAIQDTNGNGMGDVWERYFNGGSLFSATNPDLAPTADPDHDGWTNAMEALAGTDPFKPGAPTGHVDLKLAIVPPNDNFQFSWLSQLGKIYQLETSPNLVTWTASGAPLDGTGGELQRTFGGPAPGQRFWRVKITDSTADPDGDTLNAWEETALGTDPLLADTDGDSIPDNLDPYPTVNAALSDPDGTNVPSSIATGLRGFWDFESIQGSTFADRSGANRNATSFSGGPVRLGVPSQAARISSGYITIPTSTVSQQNSWTVSGWFRLGKDSIKNSNGVFRAIFSLYDLQGTSGQATIAQGTCLLIRRTAAAEQWFIGGYKQYASDGSDGTSAGSPLTAFDGYNFLRDTGTTDDGRWHHLAVTFSTIQANSQKVYVDGVLLVQGNTHYYPVQYDTDTTFTFGRLYPAYTPSALPDAMLDRLRVHSRVLTDTEIQGLYHQDIDNDGLWDITESRSVNWVDTNSNGNVDPGEYTYVASPYLWQAATTDHDGDGLTDLQEQTFGTNLANADTDGDLMPDGWEKTYGLNPLNPADATLDLDQDGKNNLYEYQHGTNPAVPN
ncbi:MAG: hypothetical protein QM755_07520 [Luteolibacter sp.]